MPTPAYRLLGDELSAGIRSGRYPVGERLPSIGELVMDGNSQGVARQALDWLAEQGWAQPQHGRGYIVVQVPPEPPSEPEDWASWRDRVDAELADLKRRQDEIERRQP